MSAPDRRALVDRDHGGLSIRRQCQLLGVARSGVYRPPSAAHDDDDLALMRRIDELFTAWPFLGSRRMTVMLRAQAHAINRNGSLARKHQRWIPRHDCGHDAALGQRCRVAHMPTAATTAADRSLIDSGDRSGRDSN